MHDGDNRPKQESEVYYGILTSNANLDVIERNSLNSMTNLSDIEQLLYLPQNICPQKLVYFCGSGNVTCPPF